MLLFWFFLTLLFWFPTEKKNAKKRPCQESVKQSLGFHQGAADASPPEEQKGLGADPKRPLVEPKMEPQEQESKWARFRRILASVFVSRCDS